MDIEKLITNCLYGVVIWGLIIFGYVAVVHSQEVGQPFVIGGYCLTKQQAARIITGENVEYGCFMGSRIHAAFISHHGLVRAKNGVMVQISSFAPFSGNPKVIYSWRRAPGKTL